MNSDVHFSLQPNYHHQIMYGKRNDPPPYERFVWHYQDGSNKLIQRSIFQLNEERAFSSKCVNELILFFNENILNIMTDFIRH